MNSLAANFDLNKGSKRSSQKDIKKRVESQPKLVALKWPTRLTIILIGTCVFFSLFFAFEFIVTKIVALFAIQATPNYLSPKLSADRATKSPAPDSSIEWTSATEDIIMSQISTTTISTGNNQTNNKSNKLSPNYDLIYESELEISPDAKSFLFQGHQLAISAEAKLDRLLSAYQLAMPFDPDIWTYEQPADEFHLFNGNLSVCLRQLKQLIEQVDKRIINETSEAPLRQVGGQEFKLLQLLDSFGRPEAGLLNGHPFWLGSYLQCQQVGDTQAKVGPRIALELDGRPLETRYCVGKMRLDSWKAKNSIKIGLCLPKSCDSTSLFESHQQEPSEGVSLLLDRAKYLASINFSPVIYPKREQLKLVDIYCLPLEESRYFGFLGYLFVATLLGWLSFSVLCTWMLWLKNHHTPTFTKLFPMSLSDATLKIMAIDENLRGFLAAPKRLENSTVDLSFLDSVKHFGCMGVIGAHVFLTYLTMGTSYAHIVEDIGRDMRTMLLLSLNNLVDTFFVISGLLVAYLTFRKLEQNASQQIKHEHEKGDANSRVSKVNLSGYLRLVAMRYLRMAPLYFLVYTWAKLVSVHLGSGPLWDYATSGSSLRGLCRTESWLWPIAFASDLKPITHHCVPPAWSLAVDLHFFLILPLLIGLLRRSSRLGYALLCALAIGSTLLTMSDYQSLLEFVSFADFAKLRLHVFTVIIRYAAHAYSQPQNRIGPILIGLLGGHMLFEYEKGASNTRTSPGTSNKCEICSGSPAFGCTCAGAECQQIANCLPATRGQKIPNSQRNSKTSEWPKWMRGRYFALVLLLMVSFIVAPIVVQVRERMRTRIYLKLADGQEPGLWLSLVSLTLALQTSVRFDCYLALGGFVLIKPLWSICNCIVFLRLATDLKFSAVAKFMSLWVWRMLSKLNYAILLVHFELITYEAMTRLAVQPTTWPDLMAKFAFAYLGSLCVALPLYVLIERPAQQLVALLFRGQVSNEKPKKPKKPEKPEKPEKLQQ